MNTQSLVCIVGKDPVSRQEMVQVIQSLGLRALVVESLGKLATHEQKAKVECILFDTVGDGKDGINGLLRTGDLALDVPYVIIASRLSVSLAVGFMKNGATWVLQKPFHLPELIDSLQAAIATYRERAEHSRKMEAFEEIDRSLSTRERQVIEHVVNGYTNVRIANALDVSLRTVEATRARLVEKYRVASVAEMVAAHVESQILRFGSAQIEHCDRKVVPKSKGVC
ncbi:MAG: response regulator transcription factor [Rubripirellula sp.]